MNPTPNDINRRPPTSTRRSGSARLIVPVLLVGALMVSACGGGSNSPGVAESGSTSPTTARSSAGNSNHSSELAYAACMRSHGVPDFPDPSPSGGFNMSNNPNDPQQQAAQQACAHLLANGGQMTTGNKFTPSQVAQLLNYAKCMRTHGIVNFPDPTATGMGSLNGIDPSSPQFNTASQACQSLLPNLGGNGIVSRPGGGS